MPLVETALFVILVILVVPPPNRENPEPSPQLPHGVGRRFAGRINATSLNSNLGLWWPVVGQSSTLKTSCSQLSGLSFLYYLPHNLKYQLEAQWVPTRYTQLTPCTISCRIQPKLYSGASPFSLSSTSSNAYYKFSGRTYGRFLVRYLLGSQHSIDH